MAILQKSIALGLVERIQYALDCVKIDIDIHEDASDALVWLRDVDMYSDRLRKLLKEELK